MQTQTTETSNANLPVLAKALADGKVGSFTSVLYRKVGDTRLKPGEKRGGEKWRYGDETVRLVLVTGINYERLVKRSKKALASIDPEEILAYCHKKGKVGWEGRGKKRASRPITLDDVNEAIKKIDDSFQRTLDGESVTTSQHAYDPLEVTDEETGEVRTVRGSRVKRAGEGIGEVHMMGLLVSEVVEKPAEHGKLPASQSGPVQVVERIIKKRLPIGKLKQVKLAPSNDPNDLQPGEFSRLKVGGVDLLTSDELRTAEDDGDFLTELEALIADAMEAQDALDV